MKRLVTIQDISCFGKCSLTAALPVISAMGVETAVVPTAVLSTHTGKGFSGYTFHDLTDDIPQIARHWKSLGIKFDAIYTGYIGSCEQVEVVKRFIEDFRTENTAVIVDPVMGDAGRMYPGFDGEFVKSMRSLCDSADCILPNATEATLLLDKPYTEKFSDSDTRTLLKELCGLGCKSAILTGATDGKGGNGAYAYDTRTDNFCMAFGENVEGSFHSTGDIFSSVVSGGIALGMDMPDVISLAVDFTCDCIKATLPIRQEQWYAVRFEPCLGKLAEFCRPYIDS